ncbi:MAG: toprim domain-containing protein [Polyangiaceae bacterium]
MLEVKRRLRNPVETCRALGLLEGSRPQRSGLIIRCPNPEHMDGRPSCSVTVGDDGLLLFRCFGCGQRGDVLSLVALGAGLGLKGSDFAKVLRLAEELATDATASSSKEHSRRRGAGASHDEHGVVAQVLLELAPLVATSDAGRYLARRGVLQEAIADGWGAVPSDEAEVEQLLETLYASCGPSLVEASGLARGGDLLFPKHRIVIPFRGLNGAVDVAQRRLVGDGSERRYVMPAGLSPRWPYGVHHDRATITDVVFVEGAIDTLRQRRASHECGLERLVLGIPGSTSWRAEWAGFGIGRKVAIALDNDEAGNRAVPRVHADLIAAGALEVIRVVPTRGTDWATQEDIDGHG